MKKLLSIVLLFSMLHIAMPLCAQKTFEKPKRPTKTTVSTTKKETAPKKTATTSSDEAKKAAPEKKTTVAKKTEKAPPPNLTETMVATGKANGYEYVDLGLSVKWATCNVGASKPEEQGEYFAWGEIQTKEVYSESESLTLDKKFTNIAGDARYDVAKVQLGSSWRMPTKEEFEELKNNCTTRWMTYNGVEGRLFTSNKNGKSIFLPAAGYKSWDAFAGNESTLHQKNERGVYWSATASENNAKSYSLYFYSNEIGTIGTYRNEGKTIRPVSD